MANALITRKGGSFKLNKVAEVAFSGNIPTSQIYVTQTFNVQNGKKYMVVLTGQAQRGLIDNAPTILSGAETVMETISYNVALYAHTRTAIVKSTATQITVRGFSGFAMLFEI